jgi:transcriptional regulator PpsR
MEIRVAARLVEPFRAPKRTLGDLDADAAAKLITAAADIAVVIDSKGIVRDVALGSEELGHEGYGNWVGQRWIDTVTIESRPKVEELLIEATTNTASRWRQVNHPSVRGGPDIPVRYSAVQIGPSGRIVVVGRDLRAFANMQQRLLDVQQGMEREFARLRHAETRYRLLFQISNEAVLVVEGATQRVVEANPAAARLLGKNVKKLIGRSFLDIFHGEASKAVQSHLAAVRTAGQSEDIKAKLADFNLDLIVSASLFRQENAANFLIRLAPASAGAAAWLRSKSSLFDVVQKLPDGFVVTDLDRRILTANAAFLELTQMATEEQVRSEPLDRWLGRHPVDVDVLVKTLKELGEIRNFATVIRGEYGTAEDVEISAVSVSSGDQPCYGMTIRSVSRRPEAAINGRRALPRSVEQLTGLVGRVPLKELVRESTDMIERLCIEAALELTDDNRASAAEILGLSRQGLYSKLRRHGLGDLDPEPQS